MNNVSKGMVAGLAATAMLSIIVIMKGMMAPIMTLMLHAVFSAVLGGVFAKL